jgi:hypothetical protein
MEMGLVTFIGLLAIYVAVTAASWDLQARLFPWVISIPVIGLAAAQMFNTVKSHGTTAAEKEQSEKADEFGIWQPQVRREVGLLAAWIGLFLVCIFLFSIPWGLPIATLLYLKIESKDRWWLCLLLAGLTWAYLYLLFDQGLHLPWPEGLISEPIKDFIAERMGPH